MAALVLELPPEILGRLERYAAERGVEPRDVAREILGSLGFRMVFSLKGDNSPRRWAVDCCPRRASCEIPKSQILERELGDGADESASQTERVRIRRALREAGLTHSVGQQLVHKYVQVVDPVERAVMRQHLQTKEFKPLLSEIIMEGRGKR